jgi:hypothetical protein
MKKILSKLYGNPLDYPTRYRVASAIDLSAALSARFKTSIWIFNN